MYKKLHSAHTNHPITFDDGSSSTRYCRYEKGVVSGEYRDIQALIADEGGFDGLGFDASAGSNDDSWRVLNIFKDGGRYVDTVVIAGAMDDDHALTIADTQFDHLGGDYSVVVALDADHQFDNLNNQGEVWSIDAIQKLASNPSQDKHYLPVITAQELAVEATRATFDSVAWNGESLSSHGGDDSRLYIDLVKADTFNDLVGEFNLRDELVSIGAETTSFDSLMDTNNRLPLLKDRLFKAMVRAGSGEVQVTNVTQTKPFKRQGVSNVAFVFDLSDGQKLSIWFHNPDSTPTKLMPSDIMISWKWLLNKRDVTAVLSPKNGDNVQLPMLASRIMRLANKNSKRFMRTQASRLKTEAELQKAQESVVTKTAVIEQLDKDIVSLQGQIDQALVTAKEKAEAASQATNNKGNTDTETPKKPTANQLKEAAVSYTSTQKNNYMEGGLDYREIDSVTAGEFAKKFKFVVGNEALSKQLLDLTKANSVFDARHYFKGGLEQFEGVFVQEQEGPQQGHKYKFTEEGRSLALQLLRLADSQDTNQAATSPGNSTDGRSGLTPITRDTVKVDDKVYWFNGDERTNAVYRGFLGDEKVMIVIGTGLQASVPAKDVYFVNAPKAKAQESSNGVRYEDISTSNKRMLKIYMGGGDDHWKLLINDNGSFRVTTNVESSTDRRSPETYSNQTELLKEHPAFEEVLNEFNKDKPVMDLEPLDHGVLSMPNRTNNIDKELDKYNEQKAKDDRRKLDDIKFVNGERIAQEKADMQPIKEKAWEEYKKYGTAMIKKHGAMLPFKLGDGYNNNLNPRDFLKELAKYEPKRFLEVLDWHLKGGEFDEPKKESEWPTGFSPEKRAAIEALFPMENLAGQSDEILAMMLLIHNHAKDAMTPGDHGNLIGAAARLFDRKDLNQYYLKGGAGELSDAAVEAYNKALNFLDAEKMKSKEFVNFIFSQDIKPGPKPVAHWWQSMKDSVSIYLIGSSAGRDYVEISENGNAYDVTVAYGGKDPIEARRPLSAKDARRYITATINKIVGGSRSFQEIYESLKLVNGADVLNQDAKSRSQPKADADLDQAESEVITGADEAAATTTTEPEPAATESAYSQEDIDYLQSIISGTTSADDVDMDKVIDIGEKDENDPLFNEALEVVLAAVDAESANL